MSQFVLESYRATSLAPLCSFGCAPGMRMLNSDNDPIDPVTFECLWDAAGGKRWSKDASELGECKCELLGLTSVATRIL